MLKRSHSPTELNSESHGKRLKATTTSDSTFITRLTHLLDITNLPTITPTTLTNRFSEISKALISDAHMVVCSCSGKETRFRIVELEFYLKFPGFHEDPFIHGSEEQRVLGQWYFHRAPSKSGSGKYKGGTRKGLDLTFGRRADDSNSSADIRGGIIIRSIEEIETGALTTGPSLLVDKILSLSADNGELSLKDLVDKKWNGDISSFKQPNSEERCRLYLDATSLPGYSSRVIYNSPRIGLDLGLVTRSESSATSHYFTSKDSPEKYLLRDHPRVQFIAKPYRHFIFPKKATDLKGKVQNFLGVLYNTQHQLNLTFPASPSDRREKIVPRVLNGMGATATQVGSYIKEYSDGHSSGQKGDGLSGFIGTNGKGLNGVKLLGMFGVLDGLLGEGK